MAKAGAIKAGEAYVRLFGDDTALRRTLDQVSLKLRSFGTGLATVGAGLAGVGIGALGGLYAAASAFSTVGDAVDKMNKRTGLSTEAISELGFAAEQEGTNIEELEKAFRKFQQTLGDAKAGTKTAVDSLEAIGLSVESLMAMSPDEQFYALAEAMSRVTNEAIRTEAAMGLMGRGGAMLIPLLSKGTQGIDELRRQARELGLTFDGEAAQSAAALNDALNALQRSLKGLWVWVGSAVAPAITELAEALTPIVAATSAWVKENRGLVMSFAAGAAALVGIGAGIVALGGAFVVAGLAAAAISTAIGLAGAAVAFLISPLGMAIGLLVGMGGVAAGVAIETGKMAEALDWLGQQFRILGSIASETFAGIADALAYGDIELAGQILWAGLEAAWVAGTNTLKEVWLGVKTYLLTKAYEIWAGIQLVWNDLAWGLSDAIDAAIDTVMDSWTKLQASMLKAWHTTTGTFADLMLDAWGVIDKDFDADAAKEIRRTNDAATVQAIDSRRDRTLADRTEQRRNLELEKESRRKGEEAEILAELAAAELKLAEANAASRAQAEAELAAAQARLDVLRAEAGLRRKMTEEGRRQLEIEQKAAASGAAIKTNTLGTGAFDLRVLAAKVGVGPEERTARNTLELLKVNRDMSRKLDRLKAPTFT